MSNFNCEHCGTAILEGADGRYITGCEHYPIEYIDPIVGGRVKSFDNLEHRCLVKDGVIPDGVARQCPSCGLWSRHKFPKRSGKNACMEVVCPDCGYRLEIAKGLRG